MNGTGSALCLAVWSALLRAPSRGCCSPTDETGESFFFSALSCFFTISHEASVFCFFVFFFLFFFFLSCLQIYISVSIQAGQLNLECDPEQKKGHHHTQVQITWSPYDPCIGFIVIIKHDVSERSLCFFVCLFLFFNP